MKRIITEIADRTMADVEKESTLSEQELAEIKKELESMNLLQDFLFEECMSGAEGEWFAGFLIQRICRRRVKLKMLTPQKSLRGIDPDKHGIRLDVLLEDEADCVYDFEPDNYIRGKKSARRARYYQALVDSKLLDNGLDYDEMKDLLIIFIQPFDEFGENRVRYTFARTCVESPELPYEDGVRIIYLNTKGTRGGDEELLELLRYMEDSRLENAVSTEMKKLHRYVEEIKHRKEVGVRYMRLWEREKMIREDALSEGEARGKAQGEAIGAAQGAARALLLLLREKGTVSPELERRITANQEQEVIDRWIKLVARADSVEDFEIQLQNEPAIK